MKKTLFRQKGLSAILCTVQSYNKLFLLESRKMTNSQSYGLLLSSLVAYLLTSRSHGFLNPITQQQPRQKRKYGRQTTYFAAASSDVVRVNSIFLKTVASSGLNKFELATIVDAVEKAYQQAVGISVQCDTLMTMTIEDPLVDAVKGALGRVLVLYTNLADESIEEFQNILSMAMDPLVYSEQPQLQQPVLISVKNTIDNDETTSHIGCMEMLINLVKHEVHQYDMAKALPVTAKIPNS